MSERREPVLTESQPHGRLVARGQQKQVQEVIGVVALEQTLGCVEERGGAALDGSPGRGATGGGTQLRREGGGGLDLSLGFM